MASCALQRFMNRCSSTLKQSYATLALSDVVDGGWASAYSSEQSPKCTYKDPASSTGAPLWTNGWVGLQAHLPSSLDFLGRLSSILPGSWLDGLAEGLVLTSHQTYRPKVRKRKRSHGFLKRRVFLLYPLHMLVHYCIVLQICAEAVTALVRECNIFACIAEIMMTCAAECPHKLARGHCNAGGRRRESG